MENYGLVDFKDRIDVVISSGLVKLTGFVFNYDKSSGENTSLFRNYLGVSTVDSLDRDEFIKSAYEGLLKKRNDFLSLKGVIHENGKTQLGDSYDYYIENFNKIEIFFDLLKLYIPIETEKIFSFQDNEHELSWFSGDKSSHIQEIERLEESIFGKKISDSQGFSRITLDYIEDRYQNNHKSLSQEENSFLQDCLLRIYQKTGVSKDSIQDTFETIDIIISNFDDPLLMVKGLDATILEKEIPREQYVEVFKQAINILGLKDVTVLVKKDIPNVSVSPSFINIPSSTDYDNLTIKRIIGLISHELERHAVGNVNNKLLIGKLKSLSYLGQEEGVAHILEHLALGYNLDSIPINRYMPRMLAGEVLLGEDFKKFLYIMNKLDGEKINVEAFFKRSKRGKDSDLPGVNPKEKLYGQGALECIERLKKGENPLGMFLAKNGSSEQSQINEMVTGQKQGIITPEIIKNKNLLLPLMLGELLRFQLINPGFTRKGLSVGGFLKYFQTRYGTLFDRLGISYKDLIKNHILVQNKENRAKVNEILSIFQS